MLFRNPISNTKKLFRKSLQSFKSLFNIIGCEDNELYQKLPKLAAPYYNNPMNPHNYQELEKFYTEFTHRWDTHKGKAKKRNKKNNKDQIMSTQLITTQGIDESKTRSHGGVDKRQEDYSFSKSVSVEKRLKEIEMMDVRNVDHVLDIEEILYYYSRLTCPVYVDIVDKFFMDICSEFLGQPAGNSPTSVNSRPKFRSVRH